MAWTAKIIEMQCYLCTVNLNSAIKNWLSWITSLKRVKPENWISNMRLTLPRLDCLQWWIKYGHIKISIYWKYQVLFFPNFSAAQVIWILNFLLRFSVNNWLLEERFVTYVMKFSIQCDFWSLIISMVGRSLFFDRKSSCLQSKLQSSFTTNRLWERIHGFILSDGKDPRTETDGEHRCTRKKFCEWTDYLFHTWTKQLRL